ncbi:hemicentin-1-like [Lacerta agilis]|uniref:hemicentin-1-like n=1 Tax=Lacerta agilis TaxID=80427 RepID=UPI00141A01EA|nr:hemicentin-1-like [Lacerta agilis]
MDVAGQARPGSSSFFSSSSCSPNGKCLFCKAGPIEASVAAGWLWAESSSPRPPTAAPFLRIPLPGRGRGGLERADGVHKPGPRGRNERGRSDLQPGRSEPRDLLPGAGEQLEAKGPPPTAKRSPAMGKHEAWRPPGWRYSWHTAFLAASVLSSCFLLTRAQETTISIRIFPDVLKERDSVTLTPEGLAPKAITCRWYRGVVEEKNIIITFFPPNVGQNRGDAYTGRETVNPDCSLLITDLKPDDSGTYSFKSEGPGVTNTGATNITVSGVPCATPPAAPSWSSAQCKQSSHLSNDNTVSLPSVEILSKPNVLVSPSRFLTEFETAILTCNTSPSVVSVAWFWEGMPLRESSQMQLSDDNRTLTIHGINRSDAGNYRCRVSNPAYIVRSDAVYISVFCEYLSPSAARWTCPGLCFFSVLWYLLPPLHLFRCFGFKKSLILFLILQISLGAVYNVAISGPSNATENDSVTLNCNAAGTNVSYYWLNGSQLIEGGDHIFLDDNNQRLILNPVTRNDDANYTCFGNNSFSGNSKLSSTLTTSTAWPSPTCGFPIFASDGPENTTINPQEPVYRDQSTLNLSCSANSNPPASYSWYHNEKLLEAQNESQLLISHLSLNDAGKYTCNATNDVTGLFSHTSLEISVLGEYYSWYHNEKLLEAQNESQLLISHLSLNDAGKYTCNATNDVTGLFSHTSLEISVLGEVYNVAISGPFNAIENGIVTLNCTAAGDSVSYYWLNGSQLIEEGGHIFLDNNHQSLILNPVTRNDDANYTCFGNNSFSGNSNGPDNPTIDPQEPVYIEHFPLNLSCSANSNPPASYSWYHNEKLLEAQNESQLLISHLSLNDAGKYTCIATNDVTGLFNHTSLEISVLGEVYNVAISGPFHAIENSAVTLNCTAAGDSVSYYWLNGSQLIEEGGHIFLDNNHQSLILNPVTRNDDANYTCFGNNSFSGNSNGPDNATIDPQETVYIEHFPLNLWCSANSNPPASYSWYHNEKLLEAQNESQLLISHLSLNDAGKYTCNATNDVTGLFSHTSLEISVLGYVTNITISDSGKAIENNITVLNCTSAGTNVSYSWLRGNESLVVGERISLSNNNQVLTINPTSRNDSDSYSCYGYNTFSNDSTSYLLNVLYGPDVPVIGPSEHYYAEGSNLTLSCTADSNPAAQYTWSFNETSDIGSGSQLSVHNLQFHHSGNYTCKAFNNETNANSTFANWEIWVLETLSDPILWPAEAIVAENATVSLECNTSNSQDVTVTWFKGSNPVLDKAVLFNRNRTLTLTGVSKDEEGVYTCNATNPVSNAKSNPSKISLAYGPNNVKLNQTGTVTLKLGSHLALLCAAESLPEAQFRWLFNNTDMNVAANTFSTELTTWEDEGTYTCQAYNSVVNKTASASVNVKLTEQESLPSDTGLNSGQIAGIVIGCVLGVALIGGLGYFLCTKTSLGRTEQHSSNGNIPSAPGRNQGVTDTKPTPGEEDIQYSTLAFKPNHPPQPEPAAIRPLESTIIYSEIKKK